MTLDPVRLLLWGLAVAIWIVPPWFECAVGWYITLGYPPGGGWSTGFVGFDLFLTRALDRPDPWSSAFVYVDRRIPLAVGVACSILAAWIGRRVPRHGPLGRSQRRTLIVVGLIAAWHLALVPPWRAYDWSDGSWFFGAYASWADSRRFDAWPAEHGLAWEWIAAEIAAWAVILRLAARDLRHRKAL